MELPSPLSSVFLASFERPRVDPPAELESSLARVVEAGRHAWPEVHHDAALFVRHVGACLRDVPDIGSALAKLHAGDLYLASACIHGDRTALGLLETKFFSQVPAYVAPRALSASAVDDLVQTLRRRLLVADGAPARLTQYSGRGALGGWLRVAALRAAADAHRTEQRSPASDFDDLGTDDPELGYLKGRYGAELRDAFRETLEALDVRDRNILRLYFLEGMTTTALGALYKLDHSTIVRRIARIKRDVLEATREHLRQRAGLSASDVDGVIALAQSRIDLTISRLLRPA